MSDLSVQTINYPQMQATSPQDNVPYYKSNLGLQTGAILSIPAIIDFLPDLRYRNTEYLEQTISNHEQCANAAKKDIDKVINGNRLPEGFNNVLRTYRTSIPNGKTYREICARRCRIAIPATIIATGCTIGGGLLVDAVRNNKAKECAEQANTQEFNPNFSAKNTFVAESGLPYYKSKVGKQLGTLLGGAFGVLSSYLNGGMAKTPTNIGIRSFGFAFGGLLLGALYDNVVNKRAKKAVEKS